MKYTVTRYKKQFDFDVARLCRAFSVESLQEYGLAVEQGRLDQMIEVCKDSSFFLCHYGDPVGLIAGAFVENLSNGGVALQEVVWFVDKKHRSQGKWLLREFENLGKTRGAKHIVMALMCNSKAEKLGKFYERLGYKPFEIQYMKEL